MTCNKIERSRQTHTQTPHTIWISICLAHSPSFSLALLVLGCRCLLLMKSLTSHSLLLYLLHPTFKSISFLLEISHNALQLFAIKVPSFLLSSEGYCFSNLADEQYFCVVFLPLPPVQCCGAVLNAAGAVHICGCECIAALEVRGDAVSLYNEAEASAGSARTVGSAVWATRRVALQFTFFCEQRLAKLVFLYSVHTPARLNLSRCLMLVYKHWQINIVLLMAGDTLTLTVVQNDHCFHTLWCYTLLNVCVLVISAERHGPLDERLRHTFLETL